jgi:hypothetical protein
MLPHVMAVLQQFPFSAERPGVTYLSVQPVSWNEASVLERRFTPGIEPAQAVLVAADLIHDDYAYVFDAYWDLWMAEDSGREWRLLPSLVKFIVQGEEFDDAAQQQTGHIQIDFGPDAPFLQENIDESARKRGQAGGIHREGREEYARPRTAALVRVRREPGSETDRTLTDDSMTAALRRRAPFGPRRRRLRRATSFFRPPLSACR